MDAFNAKNIVKFLSEARDDSVSDIVVHNTIDSTNIWALSECKAGRALPFACFSDQQTAGRGRRGKVWVMPPKSNIAMSLAWPFILSEKDLRLLPLAIAIAIAEVLENLNLKQVQVKWPNDVYVGGVKIAGVLIETQLSSEALTNKKVLAVVIGIGLNYDMGDFVQDSTDVSSFAFTDICSEIKKLKNVEGEEPKHERLVVASRLLQSVMRACQDYQENAESVLKAFREKYDYCQNELVDVMLEDQSMVTGLAKGITDNGELIVEVNGEIQLFNSADVSVNTGD